MPCNSRKLINIFIYLLSVTGAIFLLSVSCQHSKGNFPEHIILVENHSDILVPWIESGVSGAIVVNVDAHDDCIPMAKDQIHKLKQFFAAGNLPAIRRANGVADSGLYDISNFISAAHALGVVKKVVWAVPLPGSLSKIHTHIPFRTCLIDSLSSLPLKGPVLLTIDADCVDQFASYRCIDIVKAVGRIATIVRTLPWDIKQVSVSFSEYGGYLPATLRWVGNALQDALEGNDLSRPDASWTTLVKVESWRRSLLPREIIRRIRPLIVEQPKNPWLHVYLADSVAGALSEGKKAMLLDSGCCRILPELGSQLAGMGRLDEAEQFLDAAPSVVNAAAELALAEGLDQSGQIAKAINRYSRISTYTANYCIDLLVGYGYERLGDTTRARQSYQHAVALLLKPVSEMPGFADLTQSVNAAVLFFRKSGDLASAQVLLRDHRLAIYFNKVENNF
jgi:tetratricopeptide (TPR) repeat protein